MKKLILLLLILFAYVSYAQKKPSQMSDATIASFKNVLGINAKLDTGVAKTTYVKVADGWQLRDSIYFKEETYTKTEVNNLLLYYPRRLETVTNARIDHTGTTNETTLVTITVPAERLGPNGEVRIWFLWSTTNSATNKVVRLRDQSNNVLYSSTNITTTNNGQVYTWIQNRNSLTSQVAPGMSTFGNASTAAPITTTHNSASGLTFTLTGHCSGSASDHVYIEKIVVETIHGGN